MSFDSIVPGYTRPKNSRDPFFNSKGDLNASDMRDAMSRLGQAMQVMASGSQIQDGETAEVREQLRRNRAEELVAAIGDKSGQRMQILADVVAAEVLDQTNREGFCRRFLQSRELGQGDMPFVQFRDKQAIAYMMSSTSRVMPVEIRERRQILNEFHISGKVVIGNIEISQSSNDLLEEKYDETLEAVMVQEDRFFKKLADRAAISRNNIQTFLQLTPTFFARMMQMIANQGLPVQNALISTDLVQDMIASPDFVGVFDPVTKWEVLQTGEVGTLYSVKITSDAPRGQNMRVLDPGDIYMMSSAEYLGVLYTRPIITSPITGYNEGRSERGWFVDQITSMIIGNNKAIAKGRRLGN